MNGIYIVENEPANSQQMDVSWAESIMTKNVNKKYDQEMIVQSWKDGEKHVQLHSHD